MFTGIITETGIVERGAPRFSVRADSSLLRKLKRGDSIAVDGACLTVVGKTKRALSADLMPETTRRTTLGRIPRGVLVNLELPATPASFLSGHIVQGHVDEVGSLVSVVRKGHGHLLKFSIARELSKYIVEKGSIAVNGVSLTVVEAGENYFTVGIIPYTWDNTTFRTMKVGDRANIEADVLAKYVFARQKAKGRRQK